MVGELANDSCKFGKASVVPSVIRYNEIGNLKNVTL